MQVIGVDVGGTTVKLGVVESSTGKVLKEKSFPTPGGGAQRMAKEIAGYAGSISTDFPDVTVLGCGVPGAMNADRSLVRYPPNLEGWAEEPLAQYLREAMPWFDHIEVDNDAKVATLAEARIGAGQNTSYFLLATLGTGVGGGIFQFETGMPKASIFRGASGGAGEFGHVSINYEGPHCGCGSRGCIEAYIGQKYLSQRTIEKIRNSDVETTLRPHATTGGLTPKEISDAALAGDAFAVEVFHEAGELLGFAFASVARLLDIHVFIVAGGVAQVGNLLLDPARGSLKANALANQRELVEIRPAALGTRAGIVGAALLAADAAEATTPP